MDGQDKGLKPSGGKTFLLLLMAALFPFLIVESTARYYWTFVIYRPQTDEQIAKDLFWEDAWKKDIPYTFSPNMDGLVAGTPTITNNIGFRGNNDVDLNQISTKSRILCIGDSVTFGYTVSGNGATYPAVLDRILNEGGGNWEVINGGMPRYRIEHMTNLFQVILPVIRPSHVIFLGGWNNLVDEVLQPQYPSYKLIFDFLERHVYTYKVMKETLLPILPQTKIKDFMGTRRYPAIIDFEGFKKLRRSLERLIELSGKHQARLIFCTLPHFFHNINSDNSRIKALKFSPYGTIYQIIEAAELANAEIQAVGSQNKIDVIDLETVNTEDLFSDAIHPNDEGSAHIAELIFDYLKRKQIVAEE